MVKHAYDKDKFEQIIKRSFSVADVCRELDIRPIGGNYKTIKKYISEWNFDISHFMGRGWNKGRSYEPFLKSRKLIDILIENSHYSSNKLRKRLISEGYKTNNCEICGLGQWMEKSIPLELHHVNGNNTDNRIENLQILCCNCHAQTEQYRGKNKLSAVSEKRRVEYLKFKETLTDHADGNLELSPDRNIGESAETLQGKSKSIDEKTCPTCEKVFYKKTGIYCGIECYNNNKSNDIPKVPDLLSAFEIHKSYLQVGKYFKVSDNAVRKWVIKYGIEDMIKKKSRPQND